MRRDDLDSSRDYYKPCSNCKPLTEVERAVSEGQRRYVCPVPVSVWVFNPFLYLFLFILFAMSGKKRSGDD